VTAPISVPNEIAACVRAMGGTVLDDVLEKPDFSNADYWFPEDHVVAELKCLTEDLSTSQEFGRSISTLYSSWVRRGLVPPLAKARTKINLRDLPPRCAREFLEPIKQKLQASTIKKANRQIKETKLHLGAPQAKGMLLLVNDGNYMLPPSVMSHLLGRMLKGQYSSIHSVVYFSVNMQSTAPNMPMAGQFWIDGLVPEREPVALAFRQRLHESWMRHYSTLVPEAVLEYKGSVQPEYVDAIQFIRADGA
jgi:hypothetical protein